MPTSTISGYSLLNVGPATTTFSAPASCATAYRTMIAMETAPEFPLWNVHCPWAPPADCNPSGSIVQSLISAAEAVRTPSLFIPYQSPGLNCNAGQMTVGVAEKLSPTSSKVSGGFNLTFDTDTNAQYPAFQPYLDVFVSALAPGETAILCCPTSYTAFNGQCYSAIPTSVFVPTTGCGKNSPNENIGTINATVTWGGQVLTGGVLTITGTLPGTTQTTSIEAEDVTSYIGVALEGMGILVHQSSDVAKASITSSGSKATATTTPTGSKATTTPSSSSTVKPNSAMRVSGNGNTKGAVFVAGCLSLIIGASLII